jgi:putative addiction module killer protein
MLYTVLVKRIETTKNFDNWFERLRDDIAKFRIQSRIDRAEDGNFGDSKPVGEGVFEMRIHYGPGYRIYYVERRSEVVFLLAGGIKSGQSRDIKKAVELSKLV